MNTDSEYGVEFNGKRKKENLMNILPQLQINGYPRKYKNYINKWCFLQ